MNLSMKGLPTIRHAADVCVVGGGMSGLCAAVAAARHGAKTILLHDRPVLGGNASSEIRMWIRGASGAENRESGLVQELELENIFRNPTMNWSVWDTVLYQLAAQEENLTLLLNCTCLDCGMEGERIAWVTGWELDAYTFHTVEARLFLDCSGDSVLAPLCGAAFRVGREGREEFDEYGAPDGADRCTMGSSVLLQARETDHPCPFIPPEWANVYPDDESLHLKNHDVPGTGVNFWWIELGGQQDTIRDAGAIRQELWKVAYGVWDHIKNHGDHGMENWELAWAGALPGKRESRRYEGPYLLNQRDLEEGSHFEDTVAFGGWTMDNHSPLGFYYSGYSSRHIAVKSPYEIPFRCLYSRNVPNLMFAGRNISATHMALSSTRVMATCSLLGQAAGTAAALAVEKGCLPSEVSARHIPLLQKRLMDDGCFLPGVVRTVSGRARPELEPEALSVLRDGWERPHGGVDPCVSLADGSSLGIALTLPGGVLRLALDPDFSRESITEDPHARKYALRAHTRLTDCPLRMPGDLLRSCRVVIHRAGGGREERELRDNRKPRLFLPLPEDAVRVSLENLRSWGGGMVRLYACDVIVPGDG